MYKIVEINNKEYKCKVAKSEEQKKIGLQNIKELPENEGMLFIYDESQEVTMWMKDTLIPLDIIFVNDDDEIIAIHKGTPNSLEPISEKEVKYVIELNQNNNINVGDEIDINDIDDDNEYTMEILDQDGNVQMELMGGERIFSRKNTKQLIKLVKQAKLSEKDSDYRKIGRTIMKYLEIQNTNEPQYVSSAD